MEEPEKKILKTQETKVLSTFPVQFNIGLDKDRITIFTNRSNQISKKEIINKAYQYHIEGNISEALKYYQYFTAKGYQDPKVFSNYGSILKDLGELNESEKILKKAIELKPCFAEAHFNLGNTFKDLGRLEEAEKSTRRAIELKPDLVEAHNNLGNIFTKIGNLKEAEKSIRKAIKLKPDYAYAYYNLGLILNDIGHLDEAEKSFLQAITLKPDFPDAYFNLSCLELLKGDYESGLQKFEYRFKRKQPPFMHGNPVIKKFDEINLTKGGQLLVISEQGLGDTLQYMRYIPYIKSQGINVSFCAQTKLHSLIKASGIDQNPLTPEQGNSILTGQWIPLLSIPKYLKINPKNPIVNKPYIKSTDELSMKWKNIFSKEKRPIVGINWQGSPNLEKTYQGRSIPLEIFSLLLKQNEITLLSLQKGFGSEQLDTCSFKNQFIESQTQINSTWDFLENAAIIENCDLIITNDTSIAHLAGGMGKKVWLMLKDIPFWTWGLNKDTTFWYPSMKLFRQKERDNWQEVMTRISNAINIELEVRK